MTTLNGRRLRAHAACPLVSGCESYATRLLGVTIREGKSRMRVVIRQTIDPVNKSCADGRARKQCGALKGIIVDPIGCYRAMPIGEMCSPSQQCDGGPEIRRQCASTGKMPWAGCATAGCALTVPWIEGMRER